MGPDSGCVKVVVQLGVFALCGEWERVLTNDVVSGSSKAVHPVRHVSLVVSCCVVWCCTPGLAELV